MNALKITKCQEGLDAPVREVLADLGWELSENSAVALSIEQGDELSVAGTKDEIKITYSRKAELFRALSMIDRFKNSGAEIHERARYSLLTYMIDESRNAVNNIPTLKRFIRALAMLGYDSLMLYTEDTFLVPGYSYFGYQRGAYTEEELREVDAYADSFGIELIPCIQTLAHLKQALRWAEFKPFRDNPDTLLVGDERTYEFIKQELLQCKKCFKSKRIHIGMDEAVELGRGKYLDENGYRSSTEIMAEHMKKVLDMCRELGYLPMMWSDTIFREALGSYYRTEGEFSKEDIAKIPKDAAMVYWDYYHDDDPTLDTMMKLHKSMECEVIFAGGTRKWDGFATNNRRSLVCSARQLDYCDKYGIDKIIMTAWGDCGAEASLWSALPGTIQYAERAYGNAATNEEISQRGLECFGADFDTMMAFDLPNTLTGQSWNYTTAAKYLLYNDPFERIMDMHLNRECVADDYLTRAEKLHRLSDNSVFGYALRTLALLSEALSVKADMGWRLYTAYSERDPRALAKISEAIPSLIEKTKEFLSAFRTQWYKENKTQGFIIHEYRIGGLIERLNSVKLRIDGYLSGMYEKIEELETEPLPLEKCHEGKYIGCNGWETFVSAGNWE